MKINGKHFRTIWPAKDGRSVEIIDQTKLPHRFETLTLGSAEDAARAIKVMQVRGAPLIGATAAYGVWFGVRQDPSDAGLDAVIARLAETRPTAINLRWALNDMNRVLRPLPPRARAEAAYAKAAAICDEDVATNRHIGEHGARLIRENAAGKGGSRINILTHCNAGWLATVDWGTALSPIYQAHDAGVPVHVWVDETRPRNQGAALTAYELGAHGVPHTIIVDNAGGHLMQTGAVDLCITGADRVTSDGDAANKIGTYLKALVARDNGLPFYIAIPYSTIDWTIADGQTIPIEERDADEVLSIAGRNGAGEVVMVDIAAPGSPAANPAFDVTPARLITGFITERGICPASAQGLLSLYPEKADERAA